VIHTHRKKGKKRKGDRERMMVMENLPIFQREREKRKGDINFEMCLVFFFFKVQFFFLLLLFGFLFFMCVIFHFQVYLFVISFQKDFFLNTKLTTIEFSNFELSAQNIVGVGFRACLVILVILFGNGLFCYPILLAHADLYTFLF
jgi:hypothetical protein